MHRQSGGLVDRNQFRIRIKDLDLQGSFDELRLFPAPELWGWPFDLDFVAAVDLARSTGQALIKRDAPGFDHACDLGSRVLRGELGSQKIVDPDAIRIRRNRNLAWLIGRQALLETVRHGMAAFVGRDLGIVNHGQGDVVQTLEQTPFAVRVDLEAGRPTLVAYALSC